MTTAFQHLPLPDGSIIMVPGDRPTLTRFCLVEQGDWFEPELPFVRRLVQPGWQCVDVGASYGCYTLSLAKAGCKTLAIEPNSVVCAMLRSALAASGFATQVDVLESAVGAEDGVARLSDNPDSEMATLTPDGDSEVDVVRLDDAVDDISTIRFMKIDVESAGYEALLGASKILAEGRAIIQFVIRHGGSLQRRSIELLIEAGYRIYRVLPDLGFLTPLLPGESFDDFSINAFAVPASGVRQLQERGLLSAAVDASSPIDADFKVQNILDDLAASRWASCFRPNWKANAIMPGWEHQRRAVSLASVAVSGGQRPTQTLSCLMHAMASSQLALNAAANGSRLFTATRIAQALGRRTDAVNFVESVANFVRKGTKDAVEASFVEPFLLPIKDHEALPYPSLHDLVSGAAQESAAFLGSYSAYFLGANRLPLYEHLATLAVHSPRVDRVLDMLKNPIGRRGPVRMLI